MSSRQFLHYPRTKATFNFRQVVDIHVFTKRFVKGHVSACNRAPFTVQYAVFYDVVNRLL